MHIMVSVHVQGGVVKLALFPDPLQTIENFRVGPGNEARAT